MTTLQLLWLFLGSNWTLLELAIAYQTRVKRKHAPTSSDRSEAHIWFAIGLGLSTALACKQLALMPLPLALWSRQTLAISLFGCGLLLRGTAIYTLGKHFSTTVNSHAEHQLITHGLYRYVRHPAYTGLLMSFLGAGIAMGDWLALCSLLLPVIYALQRRISVEERWLTQQFGASYQQYCLHTQRWLPWIY